MIRFLGCEGEAGLNVFSFEIREIGEDFRLGEAGGQEVEDIFDTDAHAADARPAAALRGIECDPAHSPDMAHRTA